MLNQETNQNYLSLDSLAKGQAAVVEEFEACCEEGRRLQTIGICPGALVTMLKPGRCCALQVGEARLMIRSGILSQIPVSPL